MINWKNSETEKPCHSQGIVIKFENATELIFGKFIYPAKDEPEKYLETYCEFQISGIIDSQAEIYFKTDVEYSFQSPWQWAKIEDLLR